MQRSEGRILTSHIGSLHPPRDLQDMMLARAKGELADEAAYERRLTETVAEVVRTQLDLGIDVVGDGEFSKSSWMGYATERMAGFEIVQLADLGQDPGDGNPGTQEAFPSQDQRDFAQFYAEAADQTFCLEPGAAVELEQRAFGRETVCTGPIRYTGHEVLQRDIANLQAAMEGTDAVEAFMPVVAPGSVQPWIRNEHYPDDESLFGALAVALAEEYRAIVEAGFVCQVDDAFLTNAWDAMLTRPGVSLERFRAWAALAVEALNTALEGLPEDRIRYHLCWGSWNGPHSTDIPLGDIVDLVLRVKAQTYAFEAANARHEWEYHVWSQVELPAEKILMPGVIEHATHVVEHPLTVADRILRFANIVGRENVIAGTDCGLRNRAHPQVAWAKLRALSEGAAIASDQLWGEARPFQLTTDSIA